MHSFFSPGFAFCLLISIVTSGAYNTKESNKEETHSAPWSGIYYCDDALLKEYADQLQQLNAVSDNLRLKLDLYNLKYENFAIADSDSAYALNILGKFSGNAGNSLARHEGHKFSTKDADHDTWPKNCAVEFTGAWWYAACHDSNLNGQYLRANKYGKGINWNTWRGSYDSLKYVHMAIRPVT